MASNWRAGWLNGNLKGKIAIFGGPYVEKNKSSASVKSTCGTRLNFWNAENRRKSQHIPASGLLWALPNILPFTWAHTHTHTLTPHTPLSQKLGIPRKG